MPYKYKMVQVPSVLKYTGDASKYGRAAGATMQETVNREAVDGWEFYRVDQLSVVVSPGCLTAGRKTTFETYSVISFRREG